MQPPQAQQPTPPTPPFDARAARRLRAALGMGPQHVAYDMRVSYGLSHVTPELVIAWERGTTAPGPSELTALTGVLWCSLGELVGAPRTLRQHRVACGLPPEDVARGVGLELLAYLRMEEACEWTGDERQSAALAHVLHLSLPDFVTVTGQGGKLAKLLRRAVTTRWQAHVRPVGELLPLDRPVLEAALEEMHTEYQGRSLRSAATALGWSRGRYYSRSDAEPEPADTGQTEEDFLDRIVEIFWQAVQRTTY
ncbi:hypothetical protein FBY35_5620 [Streptomyces sp. SLBN-118]|nr:XRE family transcriptional regulator [Streptomyces sp. SLBN-118]TQK44134.1 hypothetical protein FBY35_5620 [Streptomyces sp. SLBN-118]